jgi:glucose/arabinose dehydrogenase
VKGGNRITLLRDADGDGRAEVRTVLIGSLNAPYGMAFVDGQLYVANQDALLKFPYPARPDQALPPRPSEVTKLPSRINHHWTKSLAASADGTKLYVGIGSNSNIGERGLDVEEERAQVWEIDRLTGARIAPGQRRSQSDGPGDRAGDHYAVAGGQRTRRVGPQLVPDYLTRVQDGGFYGWPYSYWGQNVDPRVRPQNPRKVAKAARRRTTP